MTTADPAASVRTLLEALPYIREFHGRTVVIKYGGAAMNDPALREDFARDVVLLKYVGMNPVVVHGGGPDITSYMERLGMEVRFVEGLRVSDEATVEVAKMVLVGKVNKDIVLRLNRHGQPAVGLCGDDGLLFRVGRQAAPGGEAHAAGRILVPMPASVNSSSSSEWGFRPSIMWAYCVPPPIASMQACSFGRMPPSMLGSAWITSSACAEVIRESGSEGSASQPATSVRNTTL